MPTSPLKELHEICDGYWSQYIRIMFPKCYYDGCDKDSEEACHTISRTKKATRWHILNGLGGCKFHNNLEEINAEKKRKAMQMKARILGPDRIVMLERLSREVFEPTIVQLEDIAEDLRFKIIETGNRPVLRRISEAKRRNSRKKYRSAMERFKEKHGGKSPWQVAYQKKKEYLKNKSKANV